MRHLPALIVVAPLLMAFVVAAGHWLRPRICYPVTLTALGVSFLSGLGMLLQVIDSGPIEYRMAGWPPPVGIVYYVDHLSALVATAVSGVALINLMSCSAPVKAEMRGKEGAFYSLYLLSVTGLLGIVITGDAFNLYVLLEIASLTGYALVGMGSARAAYSSLNYVLIGTIGACFYLLGVGYLYIMTGSLNMADIAKLLPPLYGSSAILLAFVIALSGLFIKMAFFPLHTWLPNAYSNAPSASASLMAPLMTKVMIYVMIRMVYTIFTWDFLAKATTMLADIVVWLSVLAIVAGAVFALAERSLKRMLTFIVVAEVGYMVGGAFLGNQTGLTGAILHIVNDAAMTLCLFMAASNIFYKRGSLDFKDLSGAIQEMPWSMSALIVTGLAVIGVPPTCGFFSKWYLLLGALEAGHYGFMAALIFSSLVNTVLFFRLIEAAYYPPDPHGHGHGHDEPHGHHETPAMNEAPVSMVAPLVASTAGLIVLGLATSWIVTRVITPFVALGIK